jgi:hypothetical protein
VKAAIAWDTIEQVDERGGRFRIPIGPDTWRVAHDHEVLKKAKVSLKDCAAPRLMSMSNDEDSGWS